MHPPTSELVESIGPEKQYGGLPTIGGKYFALAVLFAMNLLNYVDRYSFFGVGTQIKRDFEINDFWYSVLGVSFMIVYTIVSPFVGWLGDRYHRRNLLAGGVALWSFATIGTAFSHDFWHIFFWRSVLGIGEASYGIIAPTLIADLFPVKERGRAMGVYYLALPLGGALGFGVGSWIGQDFGWRGLLGRRPAGTAGGGRRAGHHRSRPGSIGWEGHRRHGGSARAARLPGTLRDPDLLAEHRRHGRRHLRHRRLSRCTARTSIRSSAACR